MERFERFTVLIANITRSIRRIKTEEMKKWNLRSNHVSCIYYLYKNNALTSKELCDICREDKANISRSVDYLTENGYVKCEKIDGKRYKKHFMLTESGIEIGNSISSRVDEILRRASINFSEENRQIMYQCLNNINDNLHDICNEYKD